MEYEKIRSDQEADKVRPLARLVLTLMALGLMVYLAWEWRSNQKITELSVDGTQVVTEAELLEGLEDSLKTKAYDEVRLAALRDSIRNRSYIRSAVVKRDGPGKIAIAVEERKPIAAIVSDNGEIQFIDSDGVLLPYERYSGFSDVPLVRGLIDKGSLDSLALKTSCRLISRLRATQGEFLYHAVSEIVFTPQSGDFLLVSTENGVNIRIGAANALDGNIAKLEKFWTKELSANKMQELKVLDLRWANQVVVTRRS